MSASQRGLENQEEGTNVVDNRGDTDHSVAARVGEQFHDGRVHPCFARYRNGCRVDTDHSGRKVI
jgi:hypothetical protein